MQLQRSKMIAAASVALSGLLITGCVGVHNAMSDPIERTARFQLRQLSREAEPVRIALLSDVHVGNFVITPARLKRIVDGVNKSKPDIVLLAGDFVIGTRRDGAAKRALDLAHLSQLRARDGVFAVLGNHDHWTDPDAIRASLRKAGVKVLENDAVRAGALAIVGIDDRFSKHDDMTLAMSRARQVGGVPIAFTHSPDLAADLPASVPILLAGHTHCGQMVAPLIGPLVHYSRGRRLYDPDLRCGIIRQGARAIVVTSGIGSGTVPLRFGASPDWWLIELGPVVPDRSTNTAAS